MAYDSIWWYVATWTYTTRHDRGLPLRTPGIWYIWLHIIHINFTCASVTTETFITRDTLDPRAPATSPSRRREISHRILNPLSTPSPTVARCRKKRKLSPLGLVYRRLLRANRATTDDLVPLRRRSGFTTVDMGTH